MAESVVKDESVIFVSDEQRGLKKNDIKSIIYIITLPAYGVVAPALGTNIQTFTRRLRDLWQTCDHPERFFFFQKPLWKPWGTLKTNYLQGFCVTMGACLTVDEAAVRSRQIDRQHKKDFNAERRIVKLLLLGTGKHSSVSGMIYCWALSIYDNIQI